LTSGEQRFSKPLQGSDVNPEFYKKFRNNRDKIIEPEPEENSSTTPNVNEEIDEISSRASGDFADLEDVTIKKLRIEENQRKLF
jgi:hypothetical protein